MWRRPPNIFANSWTSAKIPTCASAVRFMTFLLCAASRKQAKCKIIRVIWYSGIPFDHLLHAFFSGWVYKYLGILDEKQGNTYDTNLQNMFVLVVVLLSKFSSGSKKIFMGHGRCVIWTQYATSKLTSNHYFNWKVVRILLNWLLVILSSNDFFLLIVYIVEKRLKFLKWTEWEI